MIYVKHLNGQVKSYKDHDMKTIEFLLDTGKWTRVKSLKDDTPYSTKKNKKKSK